MHHRHLFDAAHLSTFPVLFGASGAAFLCSVICAMESGSFWPNQMGTAAIVVALTGMAKMFFDAAKDRRESKARDLRLEREAQRIERDAADERARLERESKEKRHNLANRLQETVLELYNTQRELAELRNRVHSDEGRITRHEQALSDSGIYPTQPGAVKHKAS